jgi:hypothetical protein
VSTLFDRAPHLRVVEPPKPAQRLQGNVGPVEIEREDGRFWVFVRLASGGEARVCVTTETLRTLVDVAIEELEKA